MTISNTTVKSEKAGAGGIPAPFALGFLAYASSDIIAYKDDGTTLSTLNEGVDYTVAIPAPLPGLPTITALVSIAVGTDWIFVRDTNRRQDIPLVSQGQFSSSRIEEGLDRATLDSQELDFRSTRALHVASWDEDLSMELPRKSQRLGKILKFDDTTGLPAVVDLSTLTPATVATTAFSRSLLDDASNVEARTTLGAMATGPGVSKIQAGTSADRALTAPAAFTGLWINNDNDALWYSDGSAWEQLTIAHYNEATLPSAATAGLVYLTTDTKRFVYDTGSALLDIKGPLPRGYLAGLGCTVTGSSDDITIAVGEARAGTSADQNLVNAVLGAALTKRTDATWAAGTNQGGMAAALTRTANTWYHVFLLVKPDGSVDAGFDTSVTAANLLADSAVNSAGFTRYRRIESILMTATPNIRAFHRKGDFYYWDSVSLDVSSTSVAASEVLLDLVSVPTGLKVLAKLNATVKAGGQQYVHCYDPDVTVSQQGAAAVAPLSSVSRGGNANGSGEQIEVVCNVSRQMATYASAAVNNFYAAVVGYHDERGKGE